VVEAFDLFGDIYLFEINLTELLPFITPRKYQPLPRFPGAVRDVAVVVGVELPSQRIRDIIQSEPLVTQVTLFDVYLGEQVPQGKKSLAFRVQYQSPTRTLTDEDVERAQGKILDRLHRELGAILRG
jgi:phenylalanyl-tRNA synthetase beta chain